MNRFCRKSVLLSLCLLALTGTGIANAESVPRKPGPKRDRFTADYQTMESAGWKKDFPNLGRYEVLASATPKGKKKILYNCIAHTLRTYDKWVWPGASISDFDKLYGAHGYKRISKLDYRFDARVDRIVLYAKKNKDGRIECTHGCRQLADGTWTSKLGQGPLIRHTTPGAVSGPSYGKPIAVYVKSRRTPPILPPSSTAVASRRTNVNKATTRKATATNFRRVKANVPATRVD
jgi:hypothetical protein